MIFFSRPQGYSAVGYIGPSYRLRLLKAISRHMERTPPTPHLFVDVSEYLFAQWPKATVLAPEEKDEVIQEFIHTIQPILLAVPHRQLCFLLFSFFSFKFGPFFLCFLGPLHMPAANVQRVAAEHHLQFSRESRDAGVGHGGCIRPRRRPVFQPTNSAATHPGLHLR